MDRSFRNGGFLVSLQAYVVPREAVIPSRRRYHESPPGKGGMFSGMKAVMLMPDPRKRAVYT